MKITLLEIGVSHVPSWPTRITIDISPDLKAALEERGKEVFKEDKRTDGLGNRVGEVYALAMTILEVCRVGVGGVLFRDPNHPADEGEGFWEIEFPEPEAN